VLAGEDVAFACGGRDGHGVSWSGELRGGPGEVMRDEGETSVLRHEASVIRGMVWAKGREMEQKA
jgi:hypothetical protein